MDSILLLDDCDNTRAVLSDVLIDAGYYVEEASCTDEAYRILRDETFQLIVCDLHLPFRAGEENAGFEYSLKVGIETIKELIWVFRFVPVIAITGMGAEDIERAAAQLPGVPIVPKPIQPKVFLHVIQQALQQPMCQAVQ